MQLQNRATKTPALKGLKPILQQLCPDLLYLSLSVSSCAKLKKKTHPQCLSLSTERESEDIMQALVKALSV